uniref:Methyltransferase type 11 domain-containing protein n=1 Tax=Ditylum brightwellii TaxID=49249 RepID=A0A7S1YS87_9STRA
MKQKNSNQKNDNDNILQLMPSSYDTVFATDVLYDLSSLSPLFTTASKMLRGGGYFVLSHVPRASVQDYHDDDDDDDGKTIIGTANVLEHLICNEAIKHGFTCGSNNHQSEDQIGFGKTWQRRRRRRNGCKKKETSYIYSSK